MKKGTIVKSRGKFGVVTGDKSIFLLKEDIPVVVDPSELEEVTVTGSRYVQVGNNAFFVEAPKEGTSDFDSLNIVSFNTRTQDTMSQNNREYKRNVAKIVLEYIRNEVIKPKDLNEEFLTMKDDNTIIGVAMDNDTALLYTDAGDFKLFRGRSPIAKVRLESNNVILDAQ